MDHAWITHEFPLDHPWITHGSPIEFSSDRVDEIQARAVAPQQVETVAFICVPAHTHAHACSLASTRTCKRLCAPRRFARHLGVKLRATLVQRRPAREVLVAAVLRGARGLAAKALRHLLSGK